MGFLDKLTGFLKGEAKDIGEMAESAKDRLDEELTKREHDLAQSPADKIRDIQQETLAEDAEFDRILDKAGVKQATADAEAEVAAVSAEPTEDEAVNDLADAVGGGEAGAEAEEPVADVTEKLDPVGEEGIAGSAGNASRPRAEFDKTSAQHRYEEQRAAADDLLDELRGELDADGEI